jgi:hypothetical protein
MISYVSDKMEGIFISMSVISLLWTISIIIKGDELEFLEKRSGKKITVQPIHKW